MRTLQRRFAVIRRYVLGVLLLVPLFFAQGTQPQAAVVTDGSGLATSITGLTVDGLPFDVDFFGGSYNQAFMGVFVVFPNASAFVVEIDLALNNVGSPLLSGAGRDAFSTTFLVPSNFDASGEFLTVQRGKCSLFTPEIVNSAICDTPYGPALPAVLFIPAAGLWAVPSPSAVPLPAALPLFGSALALLGIVGWRRKRRGDA